MVSLKGSSAGWRFSLVQTETKPTDRGRTRGGHRPTRPDGQPEMASPGVTCTGLGGRHRGRGQSPRFLLPGSACLSPRPPPGRDFAVTGQAGTDSDAISAGPGPGRISSPGPGAGWWPGGGRQPQPYQRSAGRLGPGPPRVPGCRPMGGGGGGSEAPPPPPPAARPARRGPAAAAAPPHRPHGGLPAAPALAAAAAAAGGAAPALGSGRRRHRRPPRPAAPGQQVRDVPPSPAAAAAAAVRPPPPPPPPPARGGGQRPALAERLRGRGRAAAAAAAAGGCGRPAALRGWEAAGPGPPRALETDRYRPRPGAAAPGAALGLCPSGEGAAGRRGHAGLPSAPLRSPARRVSRGRGKRPERGSCPAAQPPGGRGGGRPEAGVKEEEGISLPNRSHLVASEHDVESSSEASVLMPVKSYKRAFCTPLLLLLPPLNLSLF